MILKNKIKKIIDAIKDTDINEIEISTFWGSQKIKLKRNSTSITQVDDVYVQEDIGENKNKDYIANPIVEENKSANIENNEAKEAFFPEDVAEDNLITIKAPLVGTFYLSPKPGEPNFVNIDSEIKLGDSLCIIEAMKIFNEIESEYSGVIKEILVQDNEPVEFGQPLFKIQEL